MLYNFSGLYYMSHMKTCRQFPGIKILMALKIKPVAPQTIHVLAFQGLQFT